jgi:hypothetical protein
MKPLPDIMLMKALHKSATSEPRYNMVKSEINSVRCEGMS